MIVADVTSFFSASCGGIKTYFRAKARWLPGRGVRCHFVVPGRCRASVPFGQGVLHTVPGPRMSRHYRCFGDITGLVRLLRDIAPDIIELGSHYVLPDIVGIAARRAEVRLVGFYHADYPRTYVAPALERLPCLKRPAVAAAWHLVRRQHRRYAMTLAGSHHVARALERAGVPRVRWVGLGVDAERFRPDAAGPENWPRRSPRIVYAGRLAADKHFPLVLAAFDRIHAATGAHLAIAGDGPRLAAAKRFAARRPHVRVHGYLDGAGDVAALVAAADVAVVPGPFESFSLSAAEALACETPVVAADEGGAGEIVARSGGGLTFAAGRAENLAECVIEILAGPPAARAEMGRRGRCYVLEHHTWSAVMDRIHAAYREVLVSC